MHRELKHEGIRYHCDQCNYVATLSSSLKRHKKSKHKSIVYSCDQCDHEATHSGGLYKHKQSKHDGIRYPCDKCEYVASYKTNLSAHRKRKHCVQAEEFYPDMDIETHSSTKTHKCNVCDKSFSLCSHLSIYIKTHTRSTH